jgi:hypothetical protein
VIGLWRGVWNQTKLHNILEKEIDRGYEEIGKNLVFICSCLVFPNSQSSAFPPPIMLLDELSFTLLDEEHLLEELSSVTLFSILQDFFDFLCADDKSC